MFNINEFDIPTDSNLTQQTIHPKVLQANKVVVYGAGYGGAIAISTLQKNGIKPAYIIDIDKQKHGTRLFGVDIYGLENLTGESKDVLFVITPSFQGSYEAVCYLKSLGFGNFIFDEGANISYQYLCNYRSNLPKKQDYAKRHASEIETARSFLCDEKSIQAFDAHLKLWTEGAIALVSNTYSEYFPKDIINLKSDEVFVDCGSHRGEIVAKFVAETDGVYKKIIALEADYSNYVISDKFFSFNKQKNIRLENIAAYNKTGEISFLQGSTSTTGRIAEDSNSIDVKCDTLDNILKNELCPTFIKIDVEGADLKVLEGAHSTINRSSPKIVISAYHMFDHLWEIPLYIKHNFPNYQIFMRKIKWTEVVLYAVPERRD